MKTKFGIALMAAAFVVASCGGNKPAETATAHDHEDGATHDHATATPETYAVNTESSVVRWEGGTSGVTVYSHWGHIALQSGNLEVTGDKITGGEFVVDMASISPKDDGYNEENTPEKLVGHLATGDFFLVEEHPTASFKITSATDTELKGDLTIRGVTNEETVVLKNATVNPDGTVSAKGKLVFDRQKYGVAWAHFMKDVLLKDNIELQIELVASK
ncbi:MAG: YceI family protein [Bacteroidetes bacterium]|nr:YceI family protein [Bacteroidota bacterium]